MHNRPYRYRTSSHFPPVEFWEELRADLRSLTTAVTTLTERMGIIENKVSGLEKGEEKKAVTNRWIIGLFVTIVVALLGVGGVIAGTVLAYLLAHLRLM